MRRTRAFNLTVYILASMLILTSAGVEASAQKKSRGRKASSASAKKSNSKKEKRSKNDVKKSARAKSGRGKADRGRVAKSGRTKLSRRERRELARKGRSRGGSRRESARKGRSSRTQYAAPVRAAAQEREDEGQELTAPQPRVVAGGIEPDRVTEIQNALTKAGVFEGPASGQYDETTASAMKRFQVKNGLPATGLPSAHTLKRLGVSKRSNDGYAVPVNTSAKKKQE